MLDRDAAVRAGMRDRRDDPGLAVAQLGRADRGGPAHRGLLAVGGGDQPRPQPLAVIQQRDRAGRARFQRGDPARRQQLQTRQGAGAFVKGVAQHPVLHDVAERRVAPEIAGIVMQE